MFPYYCVYCGGGYSRCGSSEHPKGITPEGNRCPGGQFCWEDDCIFSIVEPYDIKKFGRERWEKLEKEFKDKDLKGIYDGYGRVLSDNTLLNGIKFIPCEFGEFVKDWGNVENVVIVEICCRSCYELN